MKTKNLGDPLVCRLELRLTQSQSDYINELSKKLDILPSQLIRMMIDSFVPDQVASTCENCVYKKSRRGL